jgi:hypothetical protein
MSRRIFGEFMGFFSKGLNPFKIQASFKLEIPFQFIIRESELIPTTKGVPFQFIYHHAKFGNFWSSRNTFFIICKFESVGNWKIFEQLEKGKWAWPIGAVPAHPVKPAQGRLAQGPTGKIPNACLVPRPTASPPTDHRHAHSSNWQPSPLVVSTAHGFAWPMCAAVHPYPHPLELAKAPHLSSSHARLVPLLSARVKLSSSTVALAGTTVPGHHNKSMT